MAKKRIVLNITSPKYIQNHTGSTSYVLFDENLKIFNVMSGGRWFYSAIDDNGKAWGWGKNQAGQLGQNNTTFFYMTPVSVFGNHTFCKITSSYNNASAIDNNGKIWSWGINDAGQLGNNTVVCYSTPVAIGGTNKTFCQIGAGRYHILAIDKNGKAWAWGANSTGCVGNNTAVNYSTPVAVAGTTKTFCSISSDIFTSIALDKNGKAWTWGYSAYGELGINTTAPRSTPVAVCGNHTFCKINTGYYDGFTHIAIDKNGKLWAWGQNAGGEIGDNSVVSKRTPVAVLGATKTFCDIRTRVYGQLALDKNGKIWTWGTGTYGENDLNGVIWYSTPVAIMTTQKITKISSAYEDNIVIDDNGKAWGWGRNGYGELGINSTGPKCTPVAVCIR